MVLYVKGYFLNTQKKQGKQGRGYTVVIKRLYLSKRELHWSSLFHAKAVRVRDYRLGPTEAERRKIYMYAEGAFAGAFWL